MDLDKTNEPTMHLDKSINNRSMSRRLTGHLPSLDKSRNNGFGQVRVPCLLETGRELVSVLGLKAYPKKLSGLTSWSENTVMEPFLTHTMSEVPCCKRNTITHESVD